MKKILMLMLALCIALCIFASCNKNEQNDETGTEETETEVLKPDFIPEFESTEGLEFRLNSDKKSYTLTGIGTCKAREIVIDGYQGFPVTRIDNLSKSETLTSLIIGDSVTSVYGINDCANLKTIKIGDRVTNLGNIQDIFLGCKNIESLTIGKSVKDFGINYLSLENIKNVYYNGDIASWCNINSSAALLRNAAFYIKNDSGEYELVENLVIPDTVTAIGSEFKGCASIKTVTIPNSVTEIDGAAFSNCNNLTSVTIPDSVTTMGDMIFQGCKNLKSVIIGNGVTTIPTRAFENCGRLKSVTIGNGVKTIGSQAFFDCSSLVSLVIPDSVTKIESYAFNYCSGLKSVTVGSSITDIGDDAFRDCGNIVEVINRSNITFEKDDYLVKNALEVHDGESKIVDEEGYLFYTYENVNYLIGYVGDETKLTLPKNYNKEPYEIYKGAFYGNVDIMSVTVTSNVQKIGDDAFSGCRKLVEIIDDRSSISFEQGKDSNGCIAKNALGIHKDESKITERNGYLFYDTETGEVYLLGYTGDETDLVLPVTYDGRPYQINAYAFYDLAINSVTLPDGLIGIGDSAFSYCSNIKSFTIPDSVISIGSGAFYDTAYYNDKSNWENNVLYIGEYLVGTQNITGSYTIKDGTKVIADKAFYNSQHMTSVTIPNSVTHIGKSAFETCDVLASVTIGNGVTSIGDYAFMECLELSDITIPDGVTTIGKGAFLGCNALKNLTIPNTVITIGDSAFERCRGLTSVTIGDGVTSIGDNAFSQCYALTSVTIGENVTSIGKGAFASCENLLSVTIGKGVTNIGQSAFAGCSSLDNVYINDISSWCNIKFEDDTSSSPLDFAENLYLKNGTGTYDLITNLVIPDGVTSIGDSAFRNYYKLLSVTIPASVTSIGDYAFKGCSNLTSVTIGDGVTSIGSHAFSDCVNLTSVTIPSSVTSIGDAAFNYCPKLVEVINKSLLNIEKGSDSNGWVAYYAFDVHSEESKIVNKDGYLFYTYKGVNYLLGYIGTDTELTLPINYNGENYVIYQYAFYANGNMTNLIIPNSVTSIGDSAFNSCSNLTSVTIGDSVTSIGSFAFAHGFSLKNVTISKSVDSIGESAFQSCTNLANINYRGTEEEWYDITKAPSWSYYVPTSCVTTYNYTGE